jgi:hypothetical protein
MAGLVLTCTGLGVPDLGAPCRDPKNPNLRRNFVQVIVLRLQLCILRSTAGCFRFQIA